jgi:hypothetical protein
MHHVESLARHEPTHVIDGATASKQERLQRARVDACPAEGGERRRDPEFDDLDRDAEGLRPRYVLRAWPAEYECAQGDLVAARQ